MTVAIAYPFTLNGAGIVTATNSYNKIYVDRVLTLLSTNIGQRPMLQKYGTNLDQALFENDNRLDLAVKSAVMKAIRTWIPDVGVEQITVAPVDSDGVAAVDIVLRLPNNTTTGVSLTTASFNYNGTVA